MEYVLLLADNEPEFLRTWSTLLSNAGYHVRQATNPQEARRVLQDGGVDLAIIDMRLATTNNKDDLSGLELASDHKFRNIPKIILTGYEVELADLTRLLGVNELPSAVAVADKSEGPQKLLRIVDYTLEIWPRGRRVFVVHGRNKKIHASMCHFLRELGLQPLEWGDLVEATGNSAPTIIEILRAGFEKAQAAVVLLTPEDEARLLPEFLTESDGVHERELTPQPRPNVIFEAGMVMARFPKRTVIVQVGHIREFTDLAGVHFVRLNNSIQARGELVRRLRIAGCAIVDTTTTMGWHTAGDFEK